MTKLKKTLYRAVHGPTIMAKLRRPLVVALTPEGQIILRPMRAKARSSEVTLDLFELYFRALL